MRCGDELGGHELSGHVFETAAIVDKKITDNNLSLTIQCSKACFAFIKPKAYIAVDGSSLTIGLIDKKQGSFSIHLIPETLRRTNFANKNIGDKVNLEPDMKIMVLLEMAQDYFSNIEDRLKKIETRLASIE
jgi:riboflavin synthase